MGKLGKRVAAGSFALVLSLAADGRAQPISIRIDYSAPAGCPDEATFLEQVRRRTSRARLAGPGELARTMKVTVERAPGRSFARLEFVDTDARQVKREMSGEDCVEVVNGIALVTALAIDARAKGEAPQPPAAPVARQPDAPATAERQPPVAILPPTERRQPSQGGIRWDVGLGILTTSAVGPTVLYGLGAFVGVGPRHDARGVRLTFARLEGPTVRVNRGEATFRLTMARLEGCPLSWDASEMLAILPCAAFDAGIASAEGGGARVPDPETAHVFWPVVSAIGRLQFALEDLLLFEGQAEFGAPLKQEHRFVFERPEAEVYDVEPVRWGVGANVGFRF